MLDLKSIGKSQESQSRPCHIAGMTRRAIGDCNETAFYRRVQLNRMHGEKRGITSFEKLDI
jgi:hypothetical protein